MNPTRRQFLALAAAPLAAQGPAVRNVKPQARLRPSGLPFAAQFTDVAARAGLTRPVVYGDPRQATYILEAVGCGCAFLDYDNDGWLDILLLTGSRLDGAPKDATLRLYKNNRDGTFADVTEQAGLLRPGWASAVTVGDYDNDGFDDLFITFWGQNVLYRNNGKGGFEDVTKQAGLLEQRRRWGSGCTWVDYDRDGHLDLFVANYLEFDLETTPKPGEESFCFFHGEPVNCGPRGLPPAKCSLYRNNGDGTFTDVSVEAGVDAARGSFGMTAVAADFDDDGWADIYVACDSTPSFYFQNNRDGTFTEDALIRGVALNEDGSEQAGMGLGVGDFDLDGALDIFKTHFSDDTDVLYRNEGDGMFTDVTMAARIGVETRFTAWGAGIEDLDNDGLPDLFLVTGSIYPELEQKLPAYPYKTPRVIFRNLGDGRFEQLIAEAGPGVAAARSSRGCSFGDFDNDGDVDVLIVNVNEPPSLLRNDVSKERNWLKVLLIGAKSNRSAIGARVTARYAGKRQTKAVLAQSSFYAANDRRLHFGLGDTETAEIEVRWPNGELERVGEERAGRLITIREGEGVVDRRAFVSSSSR
jgi:hypothetical protein